MRMFCGMSKAHRVKRTPVAIQSTPELRQLVTIQAAADYAKVCTQTIRRFIAEGKLQAFRLGPKMIRIDVCDLDRLLTPVNEWANK